MSFTAETMDEVCVILSLCDLIYIILVSDSNVLHIHQVMSHLKTTFAHMGSHGGATPSKVPSKVRRTVVTRVFEAVKAIALCHNVTPVYEASGREDWEDEAEADQQSHQQKVTYQASSPDEVIHLPLISI